MYQFAKAVLIGLIFFGPPPTRHSVVDLLLGFGMTAMLLIHIVSGLTFHDTILWYIDEIKVGLGCKPKSSTLITKPGSCYEVFVRTWFISFVHFNQISLF